MGLYPNGEKGNSAGIKCLIETIDPIYSRVSKEWRNILYSCLSFEAFFYRNVHHEKDGRTWVQKERKDYRKPVFVEEDNFLYFPTGLLQRVISRLKDKGAVWSHTPMPIPSNHLALSNLLNEPCLNGVTLRDDQSYLIKKAGARKRGVIKAPTGSGKTILFIGLISQFKKNTLSILILTHTIGIVTQTIKELERFGYEAQQIGGGEKGLGFKKNIVVSTIQSFNKIEPEVYANHFDMVIVDECHHISKMDGTYANVLLQLLAPLRFGFTATLPTESEAKMALEACIGPIIQEMTIQDAVDLKILAKPKVILLKTHENQNVKKLRNYNDVYDSGIVQNKQRNAMIIEETIKYVNEGKSCLILVKKIEHGKILRENFEARKFLVPFVQGETEGEARENFRRLLINKETKAVISTTVWREGIDIPNLDVVINAAGGKSEIMTLQGIGRGLRKTKEKSEVIILDFFDPSHYFLISHFGERITLYMDQGWL